MDATFWAFVSLIAFFGLIFYLKVPPKITAALDGRADKIRSELDDARRLREEAQALLADYQRKRREAEKEAEDIVSEAKAEAERLTVVTNKALEEMIERRTKAAETKIVQAEAQAVADVRGRATDVAIIAAEMILTSKVAGKTADDLVSDSIKEVAARLN